MQTEINEPKKKRSKVTAARKLNPQIDTDAVIQFFKESLSLSDTGLAAELGVEDRTVRSWRPKKWEEICSGRKSNRLNGFYIFVDLCSKNNVPTDSIIDAFRSSMVPGNNRTIRDFILEESDSKFFSVVIELAIKNYMKELSGKEHESLNLPQASFQDLVSRVMAQTKPNEKLVSAFKKFGKAGRR